MSRARTTAREAAVGLVAALQRAGHVAYFAGGCVRDALLGAEPKDFDIATDARPERVRELLPRSKYVGEAFGVVLVKQAGHWIEVATFRQEWGYADGRRPDEVVFTDAEHDARRRDFTINGLFADPLQTDAQTGGDRVIDHVGGRADLEAGLVRAIGDPSQRFGEDYLRMLRAVRFAARLGFELEPRTAAAMRPLAKYLGQISRERIGQEVQWMLTGPAPARAAELIQQHGLDAPTLNEDHAEPALPVLTALAGQPAAGEPPSYPLMLAGWLIDRHAPAPPAGERVGALAAFAEAEADRIVKRWRRALCLSNDHREALAGLIHLLPTAAGWEELSKAKRKRLLASRSWPLTLRLLRAIEPGGLARRIERDAGPLHDEGVAPTPLVSGDDLVAMGFEPGPRFGTLLSEAYDAQLEGELTDRDAALAWLRERAGRPVNG